MTPDGWRNTPDPTISGTTVRVHIFAVGTRLAPGANFGLPLRRNGRRT